MTNFIYKDFFLYFTNFCNHETVIEKKEFNQF